jgi:hypothetical protein
MRQIISVTYGVLLIAVWLCVMGIVVAVLDSGGPKWLLAAAGFVGAVSTVALAEELLNGVHALRPKHRRLKDDCCRPLPN